ncbi:DUF4112 domain-containing protein [Sphingomonas faeni]|uniref:DUF4112 domain-containing protein n=1 Tax=Sphingomonas faeni TaxID=185950 RepID=UPI00334814AF
MNPRLTRITPGSILETLPMGKDALSVRRRVEAMERVMEGLFVIPGTNRKVGLDVVLDLIPFAGSTIAAAVGGWMVWEARNIGMSKIQMARMFGNVGVDWALGMIPFVGAVPDFFFRSNTRNLRIIKRHLDRNFPSTTTLVG